jgi:hypothetical protein
MYSNMILKQKVYIKATEKFIPIRVIECSSICSQGQLKVQIKKYSALYLRATVKKDVFLLETNCRNTMKHRLRRTLVRQ